jgi:hypothetical protein
MLSIVLWIRFYEIEMEVRVLRGKTEQRFNREKDEMHLRTGK